MSFSVQEEEEEGLLSTTNGGLPSFSSSEDDQEEVDMELHPSSPSSSSSSSSLQEGDPFRISVSPADDGRPYPFASSSSDFKNKQKKKKQPKIWTCPSFSGCWCCPAKRSRNKSYSQNSSPNGDLRVIRKIVPYLWPSKEANSKRGGTTFEHWGIRVRVILILTFCFLFLKKKQKTNQKKNKKKNNLGHFCLIFSCSCQTLYCCWSLYLQRGGRCANSLFYKHNKHNQQHS